MAGPDLQSWFQTATGEYILRWSQSRCEPVVADVFGFHAVQLGLPQYDFLAANRIPAHTLILEASRNPKTEPMGTMLDINWPQGKWANHVLATWEDLPLDAHSVDLVVLPFVLDFHDHPQQVLREVERVLRPEGQVVIIGFNPWSLWGGVRTMNRFLYATLQRKYGYPWQGHFFPVSRLRDWLDLLSFDVERGGFGCYAPPCASAATLQRLKFLELAGNRWWGFAGACYLVRAVKRVRGMRLMPPWVATKPARSVLAPGLTAGTSHLEKEEKGV